MPVVLLERRRRLRLSLGRPASRARATLLSLTVEAQGATVREEPGATGANSLCLGCGLCCDGTLFDHVSLSEAEAFAARVRSLPVAGGTDFRHPCPAHLSDGRCSIYEKRPHVCAQYQCRVLKRFGAGELGYQESLDKIHRLKRLSASIRARLSDDAVGFAQLFRLVWEQSDGSLDWRRRHADLLIDLVVYLRICEEDFGSARPLGEFGDSRPGPKQP
jgi:Fe-S-cluster containining protein